MMDKEEFEKNKSRLVRNGLSKVKVLNETFKVLLEYDWYKNWEYPDELRKINGTKLESLWGKGLK